MRWSSSVISLQLQALNFFHIELYLDVLGVLDLFLKLGFTPCKAEEPLQDMKLEEKETQKD